MGKRSILDGFKNRKPRSWSKLFIFLVLWTDYSTEQKKSADYKKSHTCHNKISIILIGDF